MRTINIMSCGGTGTNIGAQLAQHHGEVMPGLAMLNSYFIDTSRSNLSRDIPDDRVFLYRDVAGSQLDGNGKIRSANYDVISEKAKIKQILHQFKPADLNIVLHSAGGGTGSVAGPLLAKELISEGHAVIVIMVGSSSSMIDLKNTLNTLKTYENLAGQLDRPINVLYRENSKERSRAAVDAEIVRYIFMLAVLFSGQNHGLDSSDLRNFLNAGQVAGLPPRLTAIDLFSGSIRLPEDSVGIGAVSLTAENEEVDLGIMVEYHVGGQVHANAREKIEANLPLHAVVFSGYFPSRVSRLQTLLTEHLEMTKLISGRTITASSDKANTDGMIL